MDDVLHPVQRPATTVARVVTPATLDEALGFLARPASRAIAGGTDLLVELARGGHGGLELLVDLTRIPDLDRIELIDGSASDPPDDRAEGLAGRGVRLGPLVTHNQVAADRRLHSLVPPLVQACREVGAPALRNRATVAGNLATASPANDTISALLALDAELTLTSTDGHRRLPLARFFLGLRRSALAPGELITAIDIPAPTADQRGVYLKVGNRRAQAISVVHGAFVCRIDPVSGVVTDPRFAVGSVAPTVVRLDRAEEAVAGRPLDETVIERAAEVARNSVSPIDDVRATADYRRALVGEATARALRALRDRSSTIDPDPVVLWGSSGGRAPTGPRWAADHDASTPVEATVNGSPVSAPGATSTLLDWLRSVSLTGVKEGCAEGECGACTVHLDEMAVLSCLVPASRAQGATVVTIEGLAEGTGDDRRLHRLQQSFVDCGAVQCGYCIPGFLVAGAKLLEERPEPTRADVVDGLAGNLCRCTGYYKIIEAFGAAGGPPAGAARPSAAPASADPR